MPTDSAYTSGVDMTPSPAALVIAHPGHELRLHHWLEKARPRVFVITDGSGSGRSRVRSTMEVLDATGCAAGSIVGALTDREVYRMLLEGEVAPVVAMTNELAERLIEHDIRAVVADACEWYNPTHDLCSAMARLAVERASKANGRRIACYEYAVTEAAADEGETLELDEAALSRKTAAARRYEALGVEVENLIARVGIDALRREVLRPVATDVDLMRPRSKPFYETHGESRVAAGQYRTVIRYEQHFRPFVARLMAAVRDAAPVAKV
jgi:hypothetical protein